MLHLEQGVVRDELGVLVVLVARGGPIDVLHQILELLRMVEVHLHDRVVAHLRRQRRLRRRRPEQVQRVLDARQAVAVLLLLLGEIVYLLLVGLGLLHVLQRGGIVARLKHLGSVLLQPLGFPAKLPCHPLRVLQALLLVSAALAQLLQLLVPCPRVVRAVPRGHQLALVRGHPGQSCCLIFAVRVFPPRYL